MPTENTNTEGSSTKRRRTENAPETNPPADTPSTPPSSSTHDTKLRLQEILETKKTTWTKQQVDIFESLTNYAHNDITAKKVTHLKMKANTEKETAAAAKLDDDEYIPKHIRIDEELKANKVLTESNKFDALQQGLKEIITAAQTGIKQLYKKARLATAELLIEQHKDQLKNDLTDLATQCLIILKESDNTIDEYNNNITHEATYLAICTLNTTKFFAYFHNRQPDDDDDDDDKPFAEQTSDLEITQLRIATQPPTDAEKAKKHAETAIANLIAPILAAIAPVFTHEPYNHLQSAKQQRKIRRELETAIKNKNEDDATSVIDAIMIDDDHDKTEAIKDIIRAMTTKHTERITTIENRLRKLKPNDDATKQQSKNHKQRDTANNNNRRRRSPNRNNDDRNRSRTPRGRNTRTDHRQRSPSNRHRRPNQRSRTPLKKTRFTKSAMREGKYSNKRRNDDHDDTNNADRRDSRDRSNSRHPNNRHNNRHNNNSRRPNTHRR